MKALSSGFSWTIPTPDIWCKEDLFVETIYPTAELSFKAILEGQTLDLPSDIVDPHVIVGISIERTGGLLTGRFYERFVDGIPEGFHDVGGALLRVRNEESKEKLHLFGRQIAELVRDGHDLDSLRPLLRVPVLAMPTAAHLLQWLTAEDYRKVVDATIPKEKEDHKAKLREALFTEMSTFQLELEWFLSGAFPVKGILPWDERLAGRITKLGGKEKVRKSQKGKSASELWKLWLPETTGEPCLAVKAIAFALWPKVKEKIEKAGEKPDALTAFAVNRVVCSFSKPSKIQDLDGQISLFNHKAEVFGKCDIDTKNALAWESSPKMRRSQILKLAFDGYGLLTSVTALRFFFWLTKQTQQHNRDELTVVRIAIEAGGWEHLAEVIGSPNKGDDLRRIAHAYWRTIICLPEWTGQLINLEEFAAKGRKVGKIIVEPGSIFQMNFNKALESAGYLTGQELDKMSFLVPITGMPSQVGNSNEYAKLGLFWIALCAAMAEDSPVIAQRGCIVSEARLEQLCAPIGLSTRSARNALTEWANRGELACVAPQAYELGEMHAVHRDGLRSFGARRGVRRIAGAKGGKSKWSKIEK